MNFVSEDTEYNTDMILTIALSNANVASTIFLINSFHSPPVHPVAPFSFHLLCFQLSPTLLCWPEIGDSSAKVVELFFSSRIFLNDSKKKQPRSSLQKIMQACIVKINKRKITVCSGRMLLR